MKGVFIGGSSNFSAGLKALGAAGEISAFCGRGRGFPAPAGAAEFGSPEKALSAPGLDFAAISLPPAETFTAALGALERGLHAVCEPPLCLSSTELAKLREAAEKAGRIIFPLQPWEHAPPWLALQKALDRGLAGEVNCAAVQALLPGPAPAAGAAVALGWQAFSMLLATVRRPPLAVEARNPGGASAAAHAHFGGADGFVHLAYGAHAPRLKISVSGSAGRLELDGGTLLLDIGGMEPEAVELSSDLAPAAWREAWLKAELSDFKKEAAGERPAGTGLRNAKYCVKLMKNCFYSASVKSAAVPL